MTASRAKSSKPAKRASVFHVADYRVRFELRDDVKIGRQSPLAYAKLHVRPNDMAAVTYLRQLERLRRRDDGAEVEGYWTRILQFTSNADFAHRGFLVNDKLRPATVEEIARDVLLCDAKKATLVLKVLCDIGLAEEVTEPDWTAREAEGEAIAEAARTRSKKTKKPAANKPKKGQGKSASRNVPENSRAAGNIPAPFKNLTRIEGNESRTLTQQNSIEDQSKGDCESVEIQIKDHHSPTTTPPISPATSDAGAGPLLSGREACPSSIPSLGRVLKLNRYRYDLTAWAFADGVLLSSGYSESDNSKRECERAHWAKAWTDATAEFSPDVCERLKRLIIEQAEVIHGRRARYKNPEAYLLRSWQNNLKDARRSRCARGA